METGGARTSRASRMMRFTAGFDEDQPPFAAAMVCEWSVRPRSTRRRARFRMSAIRLLLALLVALAHAEESVHAFNKEELEKLLKEEHSQRVSNIYDNEAGIQCALPGNVKHGLNHKLLTARVHAFSRPQVHVEYRETGALPGRRRRVLKGRAVSCRIVSVSFICRW